MAMPTNGLSETMDNARSRSPDWSRCMVYGACGYTGELIVRMCAERGLKPVLAGRSASKLESLAARHDMPARVFQRDDDEALYSTLQDVDVVLRYAGPLSRTSKPMVDACIRTGTRDLDMTGELAVFEACAARDTEARDAGVMVMPGTGFDVVPTDCLAMHLKRRTSSATKLELAFRGGAGMTHGAATTTVEDLSKPTKIRKDGQFVDIRSDSLTRMVDFGRGPSHTMAIPWGDVSTAWHSRQVPDITVHTALPKAIRLAAPARPFVRGLMGSRPIQNVLKPRINGRPAGPADSEHERASSTCWGRVEDPQVSSAEASIRMPEGYTPRALASSNTLERVLKEAAPIGYPIPSSAYGADLIVDIPGNERSDTA